MAAAYFTSKPLAPFGREVDVDLREPLSAEAQKNFRQLFFENSLLVFRRQQLSIEEQVRVLGYLGKVLHAKGEYRTISTDGNLGDSALGFHSDLSFTQHPFKVISLHAVAVNDGQTCTRFANNVAAAKKIPAHLHRELIERTALAVINVHQSERKLTYDPPSILPQCHRSVIWRHPETGADILYVTELQTARIDGLPQPQSDTILAELFGYLFDDNNIYEHRWHNGDLVIWDNLALQHARPDLTGCVPRTLQRVVVAEKTFFELCPQFDLKDPRIMKWAAGEPLML